MSNSERNLETLPTGSLGIIPLQSCQELGEKVDKYLVKWRDERQHQHQNDAAFMGYKRDSLSSKLLPLVLVQARQRE